MPSDAPFTLPPVEPRWAIIFKPWADEPIYHRRTDWTLGHITLCGRPIGQFTPMWPFKHAKKIGRPCKGCFPA